MEDECEGRIQTGHAETRGVCRLMRNQEIEGAPAKGPRMAIGDHRVGQGLWKRPAPKNSPYLDTPLVFDRCQAPMSQGQHDDFVTEPGERVRCVCRHARRSTDDVGRPLVRGDEDSHGCVPKMAAKVTRRCARCARVYRERK